MTLPCPALLCALAVGAICAGPAAAQSPVLTLACQSLAPVDVDAATPEDPAAPGTAAPATTLPALPLRLPLAIAPGETARDGAGPITVTGTDGASYPGVTAAAAGPFAWSEGAVLHTLSFEGRLGDGRSLYYLHRLDQAQAAVPPEGLMTKLICETS